MDTHERLSIIWKIDDNVMVISSLLSVFPKLLEMHNFITLGSSMV